MTKFIELDSGIALNVNDIVFIDSVKSTGGTWFVPIKYSEGYGDVTLDARTEVEAQGKRNKLIRELSS